MIEQLKKFQELLDNSLFSDGRWEQTAIEYRENIRAQILRLKNVHRK